MYIQIHSYPSAQAVVRDLAIVGQLNWHKGIREQDAATLGAVFAVVSTNQRLSLAGSHHGTGA